MRVVYKTTTGVSRLNESNPDVTGKRYTLRFYVKAKDLPLGLPAHGNVRKPNIKRKLYGSVEGSFKDLENDLFHIQNRGITTYSEKVEISEDGMEVAVEVSDKPSDKGGVADGRHTETLLLGTETQEGIRDFRPDQEVLVTVFHGIDVAKRTSCTVALNSTIPVSEVSKFNAQGFFESLKLAIANTPMAGRVQFEQNGDGLKGASVAHLIEVLYTLRLDLFKDNLESVKKRGRHPCYVVTATKQKVHENFPVDQLEYEKFYPIIGTIGYLYDYIEGCSHSLFQAQKKGKKAFQRENQGKKKKGRLTTWTGMDVNLVLHRNAVLPMISAFRFMLEIGPDGNYRWKIPFPQVLSLYCHVAGTWIGWITNYLGSLSVTGTKTNLMLIQALQEFAKDREGVWTRFYADLEYRCLKDPSLLTQKYTGRNLPVFEEEEDDDDLLEQLALTDEDEEDADDATEL